MAVIQKDFLVTINDVNSNLVCKNVALLRFAETVACLHSDVAGFGVLNVAQNRLAWVLVNWKLQVICRPWYGQTITVRTWARITGKAHTHRDFEFVDQNGNLVAIASSKWALIDLEAGLQRLDGVIASKYQPEEKCVFQTTDLKRLLAPDSFDALLHYTVLRRDIDVNQHMHNLYYVDLAYEIMPVSECLAEFDVVEVYYKAQAKLGNDLTVGLATQSNAHTTAIMEGNRLLAVISCKNV